MANNRVDSCRDRVGCGGWMVLEMPRSTERTAEDYAVKISVGPEREVMQTHWDDDYDSPQREFMRKLERRAEVANKEGTGKITAGVEGEPVLAEWSYGKVFVTQRPDDPQGILRISIGGGDTPIGLNYLVFRGKRGECVDLLRKALKALENDPE